MEQFKKALEIFSRYQEQFKQDKDKGIFGCKDRAERMQEELSKNQIGSDILRVSSEIYDLEHICGGLYTLHYVIHIDGMVLDPNLSKPVQGVGNYIEQTYLSKEKIVVVSLSNDSVTRYF